MTAVMSRHSHITGKSDDDESVRRQSGGGESERRKRLLDAVLAASAALFAVLGTVAAADFATADRYTGLHPAIFVFGLIPCGAAYALSRTGRIVMASRLVALFYAVVAICAGWIWGASLPAALFCVATVITVSAMLLGSSSGATISVAAAAIFGALAVREAISPDLPDWRLQGMDAADIASFLAGFLFMGFMTWLYAREIETSLARSRQSERLLSAERNLLEKRISERTAAFIRERAAREESLSGSAEFGELAKGIFHDLMTPLSELSARVELMNRVEYSSGVQLEQGLRQSLNAVVAASKRLGSFMDSVKRSPFLGNGGAGRSANAAREAAAVKDVLAYQARTKGVTVDVSGAGSVTLPVPSVRLNQIFLNLVSNSLAACAGNRQGADPSGGGKKVSISTRIAGKSLVVTVSDNGCGMTPEELARAFEPGFTTKPGGSGLGLFTVKHIVEQELNGAIAMESAPGKGTVCTITAPAHIPAG